MMKTTRRHYIGLAVILAGGGFLYGSSLRYPLVWDDMAVIRDNPFLHSSTPAAIYFNPHYWQNLVPVSRYDYRPLQMLTLAAIARAGGRDPLYYRTLNLCLHLLCAALVFSLGRRLGAGRSAALLAAALFAFHPIHVETIVGARNISELAAAGLLFFAFYLLLRGPGGGYLISALGLFAAALLYKENALIFPPLLTILLLGRKGAAGKVRVVLLRTLPFWALALLGGLGKVAISSGSSLSDPLPPPELAAGAARLLFTSVRLLIFPFPLRVLYHFPRPESWAEPAWFFALAAAILLAGVLAAARRNRLVFCLLSCLVVSLLPSLYRLCSPGRIVAEQRLYLPSFFFLLTAAILIGRTERTAGRRRSAVRLVGCLICLPLAGLTADYLRDWRDELTLWTRVTSLAPRAGIAFNNLGNALSRAGDTEGARREWERARKLAPHLPEAHTNLGILEGRENRWEEAAGHFQDALAVNRSHHPAAFHLAQIYRKLRRDEAAADILRQILKENSAQAAAANELAIILEREGNFEEAERFYRQASEANPEYAAPLRNLADLYRERGEFESALGAAREAIAKRPDQSRGYIVLANIHIARGNLAGARKALSEAARRNPGDWRIKSRLLALDSAAPE